MLLLRQNPGIRVLIVKKSAQLSRRGGEATVEVSAYFLGRILGLTQYLNEHQLIKQGLRFYFTNDDDSSTRQVGSMNAAKSIRAIQPRRVPFRGVEKIIRLPARLRKNCSPSNGNSYKSCRTDPASIGGATFISSGLSLS